MELAGNIILTMPYGFLLPFLARASPGRMFWLALLPGLALELAQLVIPLLGLVSGYGHSVDINDVLLNAFGAWVGYGAYRLLDWLCRLFFPKQGVTLDAVKE